MSFCRWAHKRKYLKENPIADWPEYHKAPMMKRRALTAQEIGRLLAAAPPRRALIYEVALATGFRASELRALRKGDLDVKGGTLHLAAGATKNRLEVTQPIPRYLADKLAESAKYKPDTAPLLRINTHQWRAFRLDCKRAGIAAVAFGGRADFHGLRHTAITLANECGVTVKALQGFARHSDPRLTMNVYTHVQRGEQSALAEKMGLIITEARQAHDSAARGKCHRLCAR